MKLLEDLRVLLNSLSTVTAIVATNPKSSDKAIRLERLFQNDPFPAIVLNVPDAGPLNDLTGVNNEFASSVLVSCCGGSGKAANDLADIVRGQLDPFIGATTSGTIRAVVYDGELTGFYPFNDSSDAGCYIAELKFFVFYKQS